jgi:ATP-dependent RNA helicase DOB1
VSRLMSMDDLFDAFNDQPAQSSEQQKTMQPEKVSRKASPRKEAVIDLEEDEPSISTATATRPCVFRSYPSAQNCIHEAVFPDPWHSLPPSPLPPARQFPYELDPFQKEATSVLEARESVLVAAHTSAGKTTIAEYAIAMAVRDQQKVIFTSPIKALSNQKYRDFKEIFGEGKVGLLTGDVSINPGADILIMTTEILRSMLYRGSPIINQISFVVFDEVHYMRDRERGVVWEETMILLPDTVRFVFLSATIPNSKEFAEWICVIKSQPCHIIYTDYRPTPLTHFVYPSGGEGIYAIVDSKKKFNEDSYRKALAVIEAKDSGVNDRQTKRQKSGGPRGTSNNEGKEDLMKVLRLCQDNSFLPTIVFAFSKKECEQNALTMKKQDLTTDDEKLAINEIFSNAMSMLDPKDQKLPQINSLLEFLLKGIAIHHGGLLPIMKEIIEILFCENLVKVLFCTETFAMGLNAPAKSVVFSAINKWDGVEKRIISSGEYIQMAGRAGRRGKDDRGIAIVMLNDKMEPEAVKSTVLGEPLRMDSSFYLSYNMLLNMIRLEGADPTFLIERSFNQFQKEHRLFGLKQELGEVKGKLEDIDGELNQQQGTTQSPRDYAVICGQYLTAKVDLDKLSLEIRDLSITPTHIVKFLNPGRFLLTTESSWVVLIRVESDADDMKLLVFDQSSEMRCIKLTDVLRLSTIRANVPDQNIKDTLSMQIHKILNHERFKDSGLPIMHPVNDIKIENPLLGEKLAEVEKIEAEIAGNELGRALAMKRSDETVMDKTSDVSALLAYYELFNERVHALQRMQSINKQLEQINSLVLREELRSMKRVLRKLQFVNANNIVLEKGKMGCEISSCDEVLLTEMVFQNVFDGLTGEQIVAMCSALVLDEKTAESSGAGDDGPLGDDTPLGKALEMTRNIANSIAEVMVDCRVPDFDAKIYLEKIKPQLIYPVLLWLEGNDFADVMKHTELFEGSVVRVIRRLEELVRELCLAARSIGQKDLENKLLDARKKLRRGIIFAASLYL